MNCRDTPDLAEFDNVPEDERQAWAGSVLEQLHENGLVAHGSIYRWLSHLSRGEHYPCPRAMFAAPFRVLP